MKTLMLTLLLIISILPNANTIAGVSLNESLLNPDPLFQQQIKVGGLVLDAKGEAIPGATIIVKGKTKGITTDINGHFSISLESSERVLVISFTGMKTQEINVSGENNEELKIVLEDDTVLLDDVIVTAYGTYKKSAYAGSASIVKTDALKDVPTVNFSEMLQGSAAGIQVSSASNQPGGAVSLRIRGLGSFNASNNPLYVVDGIPMISGDISTQSSGGFDIMSAINPSDIESLVIIKDAAAASLYGSRAANGVILIKTKSGRKGNTVFTYKSDFGTSEFASQYRPVLNGQERRDVIYEGLVNKATMVDGLDVTNATAYADGLIDTYAPVPWSGFENWNKLLLRKGRHQNHEFSVSGGTDKLTYFSSMGYTAQQGVSYQSLLNRISGRMNINFKATERLNVGANILFANVRQDVSDEGGTYTSPLYASINTVTPSNPAYNQDGSYATWFPRNGDRNPKSARDLNYNRQWLTKAFNTLYAEYKITPALRLKSTLSYDYNLLKGNEWNDPRTSDGSKVNGDMSVEYRDYKKTLSSTTLAYEKSFSGKHNIDGLVGYEIEDYNRDYLDGYKSNFPSVEKHDISNASALAEVSGYLSQSRLISYISRINYNFDNKYFFGVSFRRDGSSRLKPENRWGNFWSLSSAWKVTSEPFMEPLTKIITDLKIRSSYGVNGTQPSSYNGFMNLTGFGYDYDGQPGIAENQIAYSELSWETNYNFNVGFDVAFFDKLRVSLEYYTRTTKDLLMDMPLSLTTGFSSILTNIGSMQNSGIELEIQSENIHSKDFNWTTSFNVSNNKNKILVLNGIQDEIASGVQIRKVGYPYYTFKMIEFAGINSETGVPQFYTNTLDMNGKLVKDITEDPKNALPVLIGSADPKFTGGLTNNISYKWFDLGFTFTFSQGGLSYDNAAQKLEHSGSEPDANISAIYKNRGQKPGDITSIEAFIYNNTSRMNDYANSRRLHSTDHIRLKNLTFGANLPKEWLTKLKVSKVRLFYSANNLLTWAVYDQYDPEVPPGGIAYFEMPPLKTSTFGIDINF
jgi:TonB-linked SusC/RagA family outer membrane protein